MIEDVDYQHPRGLDRKLLRSLAASEWERQNQNVLFIGPTAPAKPCPPVPWRTKPAATVSPFCINEQRSCFENLRWPMWTAASAASC